MSAFAKTTRPRLHGAYPRERLFLLLDALRERKAIWVFGPPGAGKTTLLSSYIETRKLPAIWYRLDSGDSDPATFFYYLGKSAQALFRRASLPLLTPEYLLDVPSFTRRYFRLLGDRIPRPAVLAFDNYQEVGDKAAFHAYLQEALSELPDGVCVLVASRAEPPPPLARVEVSGDLSRVDWSLLRLTSEEARGIAALAGTHDVARIAALHAKSDGWAAGFRLLLERFAHGAPSHLRQHGSREALFDYFAAETFDRLASETRRLLVRLALAPRFSPAMAEALTGEAQAGERLEELYRRRMFIDRQDAPIYHFHPLFREFLAEQARRLLSESELKDLAKKAGKLLESEKQIEDAAALYSQGEDWIELARLALEHAGSLLAEGRNKVLEAWIATIPPSFRETSPWLVFWTGIARMPFNPPQSRKFLEQAYSKFQQSNDLVGRLLACASLINTFFLEWSHLTPADPWINTLEQLVHLYPDVVAPEIEAQIIAGAGTILLLRRPAHPLLDLWVERARELLLQSKVSHHQAALADFLILFYICRGDFRTCGAVIREIEAMLVSTDTAPVVLLLLRVWGILYGHLVADHERALSAFRATREIAESTGVRVLDVPSYGCASFAALSAGNLELAAEYIAKAQSCLNPTRRVDVCFVHHLRSGLLLLRRDLANARYEAETALAVVEETGHGMATAILRTGLAQVLIEQGENILAAEHLRELRNYSESARDRYFKFVELVLRAHFLLKTADRKEALKTLDQAFSIGREHDYMNVHPFWQPKVMAQLCAIALEHGIEPEYATKLIRGRELPPPSIEMEAWPWPIRIYALGRFGVMIDDHALASTGKAQKKTLEFLKAMIALGAREVDAGELADILWPQAEGDAARSAFDSTVYRLRKLLGRDDAISIHETKVTLNPDVCWVDVWAFDRLLGRLGSNHSVMMDDVLIEKLFHLYQDGFLAREPEHPWLVPMRERLRQRFLRLVIFLGQRREAAAQWESAIELYQRGLEQDALAEELYRRLMICHIERGSYAEAMHVYRRCRDLLSIVLGVRPSPEIEALYRGLRAAPSS
jgi:ATP/maltotriose-dependent transcriptional regulator MalT/DNA-binding SARP family transcriptional activator